MENDQFSKEKGFLHYFCLGKIKSCSLWRITRNEVDSPLLYLSVTGQAAAELIKDNTWVQDTFVPTVQKRGAAVIAARKLSSAMSAAKVFYFVSCHYHQEAKVFYFPAVIAIFLLFNFQQSIYRLIYLSSSSSIHLSIYPLLNLYRPFHLSISNIYLNIFLSIYLGS